jgi:hypothetical protein
MYLQSVYSYLCVDALYFDCCGRTIDCVSRCNTTLMRCIPSSYILYVSRTTTNFFYIFMEYDAQDRFQSLYNKRYKKSFLVA